MILFILKEFLRNILHKFLLSKFRYKWKVINKHNHTIPTNIFNLKDIEIGKYTYGPICVLRWNTENEGLYIGSYCSIASDVKFILGGNHNLFSISTYPINFKIFKENKDTISKGPIIVEDDVWIGTGCIILSGITIGKGSVIAAGSIVTKNVEPYSIIGGNPAKIIRKRFDQDIVDLLLKHQMKNWDKNYFLKHKELFNKTEVNINDIIKLV